MKTAKKIIKKICIILLSVVLFLFVTVIGINIYVRQSVKHKIVSVDEACELEDIDCIIVLGASVKPDQTPSLMLEDRLDRAIELYKLGCAPKIIMSGDHGGMYYDEVTVMKNYAINAGVPSEDIFKDHAGFSSYDTMYRAKKIFGAKRVLVVTQDYHLSRCLYIGKQLGLEVYGVASEGSNYNGQTKRNIREILAVVKDFMMSIAKPEAELMGSEISLEQNGNVTNEREAIYKED